MQEYSKKVFIKASMSVTGADEAQVNPFLEEALTSLTSP